jgi:hypothetical protein
MDTKPLLNPLTKHFRQPEIYFKLPSNGKFWPQDSLDLPVTGELPVYPMTARDEITLRTPDALLNGQGVVDVIHSCCPNIKNAWRMPSVDVDATLIAIRIASYGGNMAISTVCPGCKEEQEYDVPLGPILTSITMPDYSDKIVCGGVKVKLYPQEYFSVNQTDKIRYEEQRIISALTDSEATEDTKLSSYSVHMTKIINLNIKILLDSTEYIETDDGSIVTDKDFIKEFYDNCETQVINQIQEKIKNLSEQVSRPSTEVKCAGCSKEFKVDLAFDYSNFFAKGS